MYGQEINLKEIVKGSKSYSEVVKKTGKSYKRIKQLIKKQNISVDHFDKIKSLKTKMTLTKKKLEVLIRNNNNLTETLKALELSICKDNFTWIRNKCKEYNISLKEKINWNNLEKEEINELLKNKKWTSHIGKMLIKYKIKKNECEICGQKAYHNGKPLVLQCHHIDGDRSNNTLNNLQILCPNCHTQTDNYAKSKSLSGKVS